MNDQKKNNTTPLTNVEARKIEISLSKKEITRILKWSDYDYFWFQVEMGLRYLHHYIGDENHELSKSVHFWGWWKNMWAFRDENLLIKGFDRLPFDKARSVYLKLNNAYRLSQNIYPHRSMMDETYNKMIDEFTRQELSKDTRRDSGNEPEHSLS